MTWRGRPKVIPSSHPHHGARGPAKGVCLNQTSTMYCGEAQGTAFGDHDISVPVPKGIFSIALSR